MATAAPAPGTAAAPPASPPSAPATPPPPKDAGPRLPGVVDDLPDEDQPRRAKPIRDTRPAIERIAERDTPAERDAQGRFLPKTAGAPPAEGQQAPAEPQTPTEPQPEDATPAEKFTFGGVEFESREAAEQQFRTLRGQHKAYLSQRDQARTERNQAVTVASQWKAEAERLRAELASKPPGKPGAPAATPGTPPAGQTAQPATQAEADKAFEEAVDWDLYEELHETKGPKYASFWLARQQREFFSKFFNDALAKATAPYQEQQARMQTLHAADELFTRVQSYSDPETGQPYYPELNDPKAQPVIAKIYVDMGYSPSDPRPELGVHNAVLTYRDWMFRQARSKPSTPPAPASAAPVLAHLQAQEGAASLAISGHGTPRPATPAESPERELKKQIREAGRFHEGLGFAP